MIETVQDQLAGMPTIPDDAVSAIASSIAGDPAYAGDRHVIVKAIVRAARANSNLVELNAVRVLLEDIKLPKGVMAATVNALKTVGVLEPTQRWVRSTDRKGRNTNKPQTVYRLRADRLTAAENATTSPSTTHHHTRESA